MKKQIITLICCMGYFGSWAQVAIGTDVINESAELSIESKDKGLLIPRIALESIKDLTTIKAGNLESLLIYNITTNTQLSPGFYYWNVNQWTRLTSSSDLPDIIKQELEKSFDKDQVKKWLEQFVLTAPGNVIYDKEDLYFIDSNNDEKLVDLSDKFKESQSLTVLSFDPITGILLYKDEKGVFTSVNLKNVVESFQGVASLQVDYTLGQIKFIDAQQNQTIIDFSKLLSEHQKITLLKNLGKGRYQYINENDQVSEINIIGDILDVLNNSVNSDLHLILDQIVGEKQTLTSLIYDPQAHCLIYYDEQKNKTTIPLKDLVESNQKLFSIDVSNSSNISISKTTLDNQDVFSFHVPIATPNKLGVVSPGVGLLIDSQGVLNVDSQHIIERKDLKGSNSILVTKGQGAVLQDVVIDLLPSNIDIASLSGKLSTNQIQPGLEGDLLTVGDTGGATWSSLKNMTTNSLHLDNTILSSNINNVGSSLDLKQAVSTDMIKDLSINRFKINSDVAGPGLIKNQQTGALEVDYKLVPSLLNGGNISSETISVLGERGAILKDLQINLIHGLPNQVLTTNSFGNGVIWQDVEKISLDVENQLYLVNNTIISSVNNKDAPLNLTHKITTAMLQNNSVTADKIAPSVFGDGLIRDDQTGVISVDFLQKQPLTISSETLEISNQSQEYNIEIKPGKANQVLVTKADETGVEWVNSNTLICQDTFVDSHLQPASSLMQNTLSSNPESISNAFFVFGVQLDLDSSNSINEINIYNQYQVRYNQPVAKSKKDSALPVFSIDRINFFITHVDHELVEILSFSEQGVLKYKSKLKDLNIKSTPIEVTFTIR
ncbi:hypothetical protein [Myroides sp. LJL119]